MEHARIAADDVLRHHEQAYHLNMLKTYHESSIKEHLYVSGDRERALASAHALVDLDPVWAPSHGELAEVHLRSGRPREAAESYERAAALGPPYWGNHLRSAAECRERLDEFDVATEHWLRLLDLVPSGVGVARAGLVAATAAAHPAVERFAEVLALAGTVRVAGG